MTLAVKAVMLDLDGTLVHTAPEIAVAANLMLADLKLPTLRFTQVESYIGNGAKMLIKRCLSETLDATACNNLFERASTLFFSHYANNVADSQPYAGVKKGLKRLLEAGYKLACVTNKPPYLPSHCSRNVAWQSISSK